MKKTIKVGKQIIWLTALSKVSKDWSKYYIDIQNDKEAAPNNSGTKELYKQSSSTQDMNSNNENAHNILEQRVGDIDKRLKGIEEKLELVLAKVTKLVK